MNHVERIEAVFEGRLPDRTPTCEQALASSVASEILGRRAYTGSTELHYDEACAWLDGEAAHDEFVERVYQDTCDVHRLLDLDIFFLPWRMPARPARRVDANGILYGNPDGADWHLYRYDPASRTFGHERAGAPDPDVDQVCASIRADLATPPDTAVPFALDPLLLRAVRELGREFTVAGSAGMAIPMTSGWLEATVLAPELIGAWLDRRATWLIRIIEAEHQAGIRLINGGGDFAFNTGPLYSPAFFHEFVAPHWKRIFDRCRELGMWYIFRSDGNLWSVADDLFGRGRPHAYYECDYDAGMRFSDLRDRYPDLVLMGNLSCSLLLNGTPREIRERTIECIRSATPRVVAASANSILHGTPPENLQAMFEAARECPVGSREARPTAQC